MFQAGNFGACKSPPVWMLVWIIFLYQPAAINPASPEFLTPVSSFSVSSPVTSLSISADEALVAVGTEQEQDAWVEIRERQSTQILTKLVSRKNPVSSMEFHYHKRMLALSGSTRLELWDLENLDSAMGAMISDNQRIWFIQTRGPAVMRFSRKAAKLRWIDNQQLKEIPLQPPFIENTIWTGEGESPQLLSFSFDPDEKVLALAEKGTGQIRLVQPWQKTVLPSLDYHLFPVRDLFFYSSSKLLSLDREGALSLGDIETRIKTAFQPQAAGTPASDARRLHPVYRNQIMLITADQPARARVVDQTGKIYQSLPLAVADSAAVSASGRYVISADPQNKVHIFQTVRHQSPQEYMRKLRTAGAQETARRYRNHLAQPIPLPGSRNQAASRPPLKILEDSLFVAEETEQLLETERLVNEILLLEPDNVHAIASRKRLNERKDKALLEKSMLYLEARDPAEAVNLLKQIVSSSRYYPDARLMIKQADQMAQTNLTLKNAKQQMRLDNWEGAEILLKQILEYEPQNQEAKNLLEEAEWGGFWNNAGKAALVLLVVVGGSGVLWMLYAKRIRIGSWITDEKEEPVTLKTFPNINLRKKHPPKPGPDEQRFRETLQKTGEFLALAKQRDESGEYTAWLLDFEAEMKVISSKGNHGDADFKHLTSQLLVLMQTLRGLKFHKRRGTGRANKQKDSTGKDTSDSKTFYDLLEVPTAASAEEIRKAYHRKIKEYHPDRHQNTEFEWIREQAAEMSRNLRVAYETLVDESARKRYDESLGRKHSS